MLNKGVNNNRRQISCDRLIIVGVIFLILFGVVVVAEVEFPSSVNINILQIIYSKFNGGTTDFNSYNESELTSLNSTILEIISYGRVLFEESLNIVSMHRGDYRVDFDQYVNISENLIYVDEYELPGINRQAVLSLRGLGFSDPVIYNKGVECLSCALISYIGGELTFRTVNFEGPYYARERIVPPVCGDGVCEGNETSSTCPDDCEVGPVCGNGVCESGEDSTNCLADCEDTGDDGDDGGDTGDDGGDTGGGDTTTTDNVTDPYAGIYDFKVFPTLIELKLRKGAYFQKTIMVENNGSKPISIGIGVEELNEFIFPEVRSFTIDPGEKRNIRFDIYVSNSVPADVYLGKIRFRSAYRERQSEIVMQVLERDALFDIRTEVIKKYVNPNGRVRANISLINMGDLRNFDVSLEYKMIDFDKVVHTIKEEQFAINQTYSNVFFLDIPENASMGNYIFYATVRYQDVNATSYDTFVVERISTYAWILLIIVIILLMYLTYRWYIGRKEMENYKFWKRESVSKPEISKVNKVKESEKVSENDIDTLPVLP